MKIPETKKLYIVKMKELIKTFFKIAMLILKPHKINGMEGFPSPLFA